MDIVKIGRFLAQLRQENNLTQEQLGERLRVTNKTVSRWENGHYLPPTEMLLELSELYGVSINEILSGRRLDDPDFKAAAEENICSAVSVFSAKERKSYFVKKWKREHFFEMILHITIIAAAFFAAFHWNKPVIVIITALLSFAADIINYNRMMAYAEKRAFEESNRDSPKK